MNNIEKCKLTKVYVNDTKKSGEKLLTKDGRPYRKIAIQTDRHAGYLSDFIFRDDDEKLTWKIGDEVEIIAYENGEYKNFKVPTRLDCLELRVEALEDLLNSGGGISKHSGEAPIIGVEEETIDIESLPF